MSGKRDYRCAICGGPFRSNIALRSRSRDGEHQEGPGDDDDLPQEWDYDGFDPSHYHREDVEWLEKARILAFNSTAGVGTTRAFVSGVGDIGPRSGHVAIGDGGDDPSAPDYPLMEYSCYSDTCQHGPAFPFHPCCYELLLLNFSEQHGVPAAQLDKDLLYNVMFGLMTPSGEDALFLDLDYGMPVDRAFDPKPGGHRDPVTVIPLIGAAAAGTFYDLSPYAAMRPPVDVQEYSSAVGSAPPVGPDALARLPLEVVTLIASFLDTRSVFRLIETSATAFSAVVRNRCFWKRHLQAWYRWYFEWQAVLLRDTDPFLRQADLMQVAFRLDRLGEPALISDMIMTNRRRIWGVCDQLARRYLSRRRSQQRDSARLPAPGGDVMGSVRCGRLAVVRPRPAGARLDLVDAYWVRSAEDHIHGHPRVFEALFDAEDGLVGLSLAPVGQRRHFGRHAVDGLGVDRGEVQAAQGCGRSAKDAVDTRPSPPVNETRRFWKHTADIAPGQAIKGLILHLQGTNAHQTHGVSWTVQPPSKTIGPIIPTYICGLTIVYLDGETALLGSAGDPRAPGNLCHRPLLVPEASPSSTTQFELVGMMGQTLGEIGEEVLASLALLYASRPVRGASLDVGDGESWTAHHNPLAAHLWKDSSATVRGDWVWEHDRWLALNTLPLRSHADTIPKEMLLWARTPSEIHVHDLKRLSGWLAPRLVGDMSSDDMYELCGLRAEYGSSRATEVIGMTEIDGRSWPEDELVHFEIDGGGGEFVDEIGMASASGEPSSLYMRTNRGREVVFARPSSAREAASCRRARISPAGGSVVGVVLAFGRPGGWDVETEDGDDDDDEDEGHPFDTEVRAVSEPDGQPYPAHSSRPPLTIWKSTRSTVHCLASSFGGSDRARSRYQSRFSTMPPEEPIEYDWIDGVECLGLYEPGGYHPVMIDTLLHGRYRIVDKLGFGGYSTVWLAHDVQLQRYVAVKVSISGPSLPRRESAILRALSAATATPTPSAVGGAAIGACDAIPCILDEFEIRGPNGTHACYAVAPAQGNLREASFSRLFPIDVARALAAKLALAVYFVHSQGIVHGDIHLRNVLVKLPSSFDDLSVDQFRHKFGEPETAPIRRVDGGPLPPDVPTHAVTPLYLGKKAQDFALDDARGLILGDFGEAFAPAAEQRLGRHCNTPVAKRAPETLFEPDAPVSYPSDIWSLGLAMWEILGMRALFGESETRDEVAAQQIDVLGSRGFPPAWARERDGPPPRGKEGTPRRPATGDRETWPPLDDAFEEFVQKHRRRRATAGVFGEQETRAVLGLMRGMLAFRPEDRLTIREVLGSEWMVKWAMPGLERG
ncbi:Serine/threonine-protein kinase spk-1 [Colletotrichum tanaceti]|uniref:non-specific serine/threonine protein kinase n=1 Tax=Colletotrichum tanaceti TaxID=1306861 RepID=A0A4U6X093_9PEZI|nr:Serine/threonine-protein kinase spk-1 [Colletotrichum tanaceti]